MNYFSNDYNNFLTLFFIFIIYLMYLITDFPFRFVGSYYYFCSSNSFFFFWYKSPRSCSLASLLLDFLYSCDYTAMLNLITI